MNKVFKIAAIVALPMLASACAAVPSSNGYGWLNRSRAAESVTSNAVARKTGTACAENIVGVVIGDSSIEAAKKDGKISSVVSVDYDVVNVLYLYGKRCTIVHGN